MATESGWVEPPAPPRLSGEKVQEFVSYARQMVGWTQREMDDLRSAGRNVDDLLPIVEGWEFMATTLRDTYDLEE